MTRTISHDAFARYELRRTVITPRTGQTCDYCGGLNGYGRLFAYHTVADDSLSGRRGAIRGVYCSVACMRQCVEG